jgi:hypothetical protein
LLAGLVGLILISVSLFLGHPPQSLTCSSSS